ncbi:hypothetical protein IEZ26_20530 [Nocardioides cavernae]|uniref:Uncharacterized protein n=1 Tax=Nocardioides cavernae TaxID=1921566 RepID=A0ABR8NKQ9_9ACTN|nr:hypothetical protein [Nocardioides cavernae]MBD3927019.1 hypothetical protein [Nocardioides cavernae]MBM7512739.1 hypothetical protein [Nocardioides cavernae]
MKLLVASARILGSCIGALLVPLTVIWLVEIGVAGAWKWLPGCAVLIAGLAGCSAAALWWPRALMRATAVVAALVWGTVALSAAYWPAVTTRAEVREAFDRVGYDGGIVDPTIWELGGSWCAFGSRSLLGCPRLSADYLVNEGESEDVIRALEEAGFELVKGARPRPVESFDHPGSGSMGVGSRYWFKDDGMRVEVTVIDDQDMAVPMQGMNDLTAYVPTSTERVSLEFSDAANPHQLLDNIAELGFWSPDASLEDVQPPPGW